MKLMKNLIVSAVSTVFLTGTIYAYPEKGSTVRLIVPFSAGSGTDLMTRTLIEDVQKNFNGANIVIENKPGVNGGLAAEQVAKAAPDGKTLLLTTSSSFSANPWLYTSLKYDPIKDFTPIVRTTEFPFFLVVNGKSPIKNIDDFLKHVRSKSKLTLGYGNATGQVANEHLKKVAKFEAVSVPYRSTPPAMVDLIGGQFDAMFVDIASASSLIKEGRLRPLALMSDKRSATHPEIPALGEKFPGFTYVPWGGLVGPAGLKPEIVEKLNSLFAASLNKPEIISKFKDQGLLPYPSSPIEFAKFIKEQKQEWGTKIKDAAIQID